MSLDKSKKTQYKYYIEWNGIEILKISKYKPKDKEIFKCDDNVLGYTSISSSKDIIVNLIIFDKAVNELYALRLIEDGGGESYHRDSIIIIYTCMTDLIDAATEIYKDEHKYKHNCKDCWCEVTDVKDLKKIFIKDKQISFTGRYNCSIYWSKYKIDT